MCMQNIIVALFFVTAPTVVALGEPATPVPGVAGTKDVEEMIVSAERLPVPSLLQMEDTYQAQEQGTKHFRRRDYARAYPHLVAAAKMGFKTAQARLGYIYLHGLGGIPYDPVRGIGWLSVAAEPETLPWIRRYSERIWRVVPSRYMADMATVADRYRAKYGRNATGVSCNRNRRAGTHLVSLTCLFDDEIAHEDALEREAMLDLWLDGTGAHGRLIILEDDP